MVTSIEAKCRIDLHVSYMSGMIVNLLFWQKPKCLAPQEFFLNLDSFFQNWENQIASQMYMLIWIDFFLQVVTALVVMTIWK